MKPASAPMGRSRSSSYQRKRLLPAAYQVSPSPKNGVPSANWRAWLLEVTRRKPRRSGLACFSASVHATAVNVPRLFVRPGSAGVEPLVQRQVPGAVATTRTRKVLSPSQKP